MDELGGFWLASSVTVIDVLQRPGLPCSMDPWDSSPEVIMQQRIVILGAAGRNFHNLICVTGTIP